MAKGERKEIMNRSKNLQSLRAGNRAAIIRAIVLGYATSRIELSSYLGLSKMAISTLVSDLLADGYLVEMEHSPSNEATLTQNHRRGKRPTTLIVPPNRIHAISINIRRYEIHCTVMEINGKILERDSAVLPEGCDNAIFLALLTELLDRCLGRNRHLYIAGIGVSSPGPLNLKNRAILRPPLLYNISNVAIGEILEQRYDVPIFFDNDMNANAVAECLYGIGKKVNSLIYVGLGGIGSGIVLDRKLIHGGDGYAGEIAHISVNSEGYLCHCGQRGCFEYYANSGVVLQKLKNALLEDIWRDYQNQKLSKENQQVISQCRDALRTMLVILANTFDPQVIIFGEVPTTLFSIYFEDMERYMNDHMFNKEFKKIHLYPASFGDDAPLVGSASLVFKEIFEGELPLPSGT